MALAGTDPKLKPEDYPVHAEAGGAAIGAEFMVHSFSGQGETFIAPDYLVVEVALFPPRDQEIQGGTAQFLLRLNGGKHLLLTQTPQMVAASLHHPEWRQGPQVELAGGVDNTTVILGRPIPPQGPGPTDPNPRRTPEPPPMPRPDNPSGMGPSRHVTAEELVVETAFPEAAQRSPISGFVYFPYKGKINSIKSLELLWGDTVLKLR